MTEYELENKTRAVRQLVELLDSSQDDPTFAAIIPEVRSILGNTTLPRDVIHSELMRVAKDPAYQPPVIGSVGIELRGSTGLRALLLFQRATPRPSPAILASEPADFLIGSFDATLAVVNYSSSTANAISEEPPINVEPGQVLELSTTLTPRVIYARRAGWYLRIVRATSNPFVWQYDMQTLTRLRVASSASTTSRTQTATRILGKIGNEASLPVLQSLLEHPAHNLRWEAASSILRLDESAGREACNHLLADEHAEVRRAAEATLSNFSKITAAR